MAGQLEDLDAAVRCEQFPVTGAVKELYQTPVLHWTDGANGWQLQHRRQFAAHLASAELPHPLTGPLRHIDTADRHGAWLLDTSFSAQRATQAAADGALGIVLSRGVDSDGWMPKTIAGPPTVAMPVLSVRDDIHQHMNTVSRTGAPAMTASVPLRGVDVTGINVHATFRQPQPGGMSLLLTAHFDGVGDDPDIRLPAACDNASGVAVVIHAAQIITATCPNIGVAVTLLDAEEAGLHGSAHHAPQVPPGTFVINLDGAATLDEPAAVQAGGPAQTLLYALDHAARQTGVPLQALAQRSDNRRYAAAGLPTIGIGMGMPGYQTPAETPDRIQPATLIAATQLLVATAQHLTSATGAGAGSAIAEIDRTELAALIGTGNVTVVEALPEHVFAEGHLPGAVNVRPRRVDELAPKLLPDLRAPVVVYCGDSGCDASHRVALHLTRLGYHNVRRYTGGKQDWTDAGLPLETPAPDRPAA